MYKWYSSAMVCYAYLADVSRTSELKSSEWFKRGWTLQELIAPQILRFYSAEWSFLGNRGALATSVREATGIPETLLADRPQQMDELAAVHCLHTTSIAKRMSWARSRKTTREEDLAYCLMGIFNVNMPLLYGEGGKKAFVRLQEEIMRTSGDQSILVHTGPSLLAPAPEFFTGDVSTAHRFHKSAISIGDGDLTLDVLMCPYISEEVDADPGMYWLAILNCTQDSHGYLGRPALVVREIGDDARFQPVDYADGRRVVIVRSDHTLRHYIHRWKSDPIHGKLFETAPLKNDEMLTQCHFDVQ